MKLTELAIKRPILFIVFYLIIAGLGILGYSKLRYELLPELATPVVTVTAVYPGGAPSEIENTVSKKLEDAISGVNKIKRVSTYSAENSAVVSIEFVADADPEKAIQDVQRAINKVLPELPAAVKSPTIESYSINDEPVLRIGTTANIPEAQLYEMLDKQIRQGISQINNVGRVTLLGGSPREVKVAADLEKLRAYGIGMDELAQAIQSSNVEIPIGAVKSKDGEFDVRTTGKATDFEQLRMQPVRVQPDGSTIFVKDVANITEGQKEATVMNRVNGKNSIALLVNKQTGANAVEAAKLVREHLTELESLHSNIGLKFSVISDSSEFTLKAANSVYFDFFLAVLLVALVMLVFLHSLRNAITVLIAIPTSLLVAFIMMFAMDYSLNLMTLLAMSLVIGILVDDSIVVLENIYRHMEMGSERVKASLDGRTEIGFAAMSITLVDVVVFLPLAFVPGLVGSLVKEFALVIVVSTLSSLMVSFTLTPMISSRFAKLTHLDGKTIFSRFAMFFEKQIAKLTDLYERILAWSLVNKWKTVGISAAFLIASLSLLFTGHVGSEFVPATDKGELSLMVTAPPGTRIQEMDRIVKSIEQRVNEVPEVTNQFTLVGYQSDGSGENRGGNVASINISLVEAKDRSKSISEIGRELKKIALLEAGVKVDVSTVGLFGTNAAPIQLLLHGENRDTVFATARRLLEDIRKVDGIVAPKLSVEDEKPSLQVNIDRKKLGDLGLTVEGISTALRIAVNGYEDMKYTKDGTEIDMRISLREQDKATTSNIENFPFVNAQGQMIYLKQFADVRLATAPSMLERRNKQSAVMLMAKVTGRPTGDIGEDIKAIVAKNPLPASVTLRYEGDLDLQDDAFGSLAVALVMSLCLIYLIMVALYNNWAYPFVVLFSIPVGVGGSVVALALAGNSLNIFSIFGLIMMMGLVAKNAILLVDRANERLAEGDSLRAALLDAGRTRLRPILMTTLAMVIGMLPLALSKGASSEMISSLAWVLIGGLTSSMFLTLLLVPVVHYGITRLMERSKQRKALKVNKSGIATVLLLIGGLQLSAQTQPIPADSVYRLTVEQAVGLGLQNNRMVKAGELSTLKSQYATKEIEANRYPQINASTTYIRNIKPTVFFFPGIGVSPTGDLTIDNSRMMPVNGSAKNHFSGLVDLQLPIFNPQLREGIRLSKLNTALSEAEREMTKWELADEIRRAYYNIRLAILNRELVHKAIERAEQTMHDTRVLYKNDLALVSDTLNVYINVQNQKPNLYMAENQIVQATDYLKELIGLPFESTVLLQESISEETLTSLLFTEQNGSPVFEGRPDIRQNISQQALAKKQIDLDKSRRLPTLDFISQYQIQAQHDHFRLNQYTWPNSFYVGLQLNIPIFSGFRNDHKAKQSTIALQELKIAGEQLNSKALLEYRKAQGDLQEAMSRINVAKDIVQASEKSLELIDARYRKGVGRYQDVLDGQFSLIQANNSYNKAVYDAFIASAALKKAIGTIQ
ncbi:MULTISPECIES: efflux RND transporter permease subunit [Bacteroidota]|uniref:Hydrophobe/amphiphile efflux-1 (HAE1) family protein n=2 Tax=Chryseobacterium group TaxID=2782232 RepID=A0A1N7QAU5_9FLAO|nr:MULTISPECIES: efflux RND transporter permease subunit [Bacteroidota]SHK25845.1 hydrophobe/amphiphile efflux-1 (HAE1) family protein [Epilithonimonas mollis]SIT19971.1 hydrophobe/amphiphile efflux-1 (HAE1) family protein [Chryseobacterium ureilyticum]